MEHRYCCERYKSNCEAQTTTDFFRHVCQKEGSYCPWMDFYTRGPIINNAITHLNQPRYKLVLESIRNFSIRPFLSEFKPTLDNILKNFKLKQLQKIPTTYFLHHN